MDNEPKDVGALADFRRASPDWCRAFEEYRAEMARRRALKFAQQMLRVAAIISACGIFALFLLNRVTP